MAHVEEASLQQLYALVAGQVGAWPLNGVRPEDVPLDPAVRGRGAVLIAAGAVRHVDLLPLPRLPLVVGILELLHSEYVHLESICANNGGGPYKLCEGRLPVGASDFLELLTPRQLCADWLTGGRCSQVLLLPAIPPTPSPPPPRVSLTGPAALCAHSRTHHT